jgi:hypothetical protein
MKHAYFFFRKPEGSTQISRTQILSVTKKFCEIISGRLSLGWKETHDDFDKLFYSVSE